MIRLLNRTESKQFDCMKLKKKSNQANDDKKNSTKEIKSHENLNNC